MRADRALFDSVIWLAAAFGAAAWFLLSTATLGRTGWQLTLAVALLGAVALTAGHLRRGLIPKGRTLLESAAGGILAFWAAPAIVLSQRASDAPSGSETLMFSVVAWSAIVAIVALLARTRSGGLVAIAGIVAVLAGNASLLANWERPSSFSPLVRWPGREGLMLVAGAVFAVGTMLLLHSEKRAGTSARAIAVMSAAAAAAIVSVPALLSSGMGALGVTEAVLLALAYGLFVFGWTGSSAQLGPIRAATALGSAPCVLMGLIIVEKLTGVRGTDPIVWKGASGGVLLALSGVAALLGTQVSGSEPKQTKQEPLAAALLAAGALAAGLGAVTLALPAIHQSAQSLSESMQSFSARWVVPGYQSGAGVAVFSAGIAALSAAWAVSVRARTRAWALPAVICLVAVGASLFLGDSTFATWNSWVPGDIQHAYGTEYARLTVMAISQPVRTFSAAFSLLVVVAAAALALVRGREGMPREERS